MRLSVIVPVYGVEAYIARCAKSILEQSYADKEIIFVDDATPDRSMAVLAEVVKAYNAEVTILSHPHNRGLAAARKTGLDAATGEYIVSVDGDDYLEAGALELLAAKAEETQADIIRMNAYFEWPDQRVVYRGEWSTDPRQYCRLMLSAKTFPSVWLHMIRRDLYERTGIYPIEGLNYGEDFVVVPRLCWLADSIARVEQPLYHYIQSNAGSMVHAITPAAIRNLSSAFEVLRAFFADKDGCMDALRAGEWLKKTEHVMLVTRADYALVDTIPCTQPLDTRSMTLSQRIAARLMARKRWTLLSGYCGCRNGWIRFKQRIKGLTRCFT